jgi:ankyrin repeat protein
MLLNAEADVDKTTNDGSTPLLMAAQGGHLELVEMMLKA